MTLTTCITPICAQAQVDRYKQLLLKQRDIMIALTQVMGRASSKRIMVIRRLGVYCYSGITLSEPATQIMEFLQEVRLSLDGMYVLLCEYALVRVNIFACYTYAHVAAERAG